MRRPNLLLAHWEGLEVYGEADLDQFDEVGRLLRRQPVSSWSDPEAAGFLAEVEVLVGHWGCPPLDADLLARAPQLKMYAHAGGTVKGVVTDVLWERDILVTSGANANAEPVAEYTLAAILFANKDVLWARELTRDASIAGTRQDGQAAVGNWDKVVGIVGASLVGRRVIELLAAFPALEVAVYDPYLDAAEAAVLGVEKMELDALCAAVDVLSIHAPLLPATEGLIGRTQLAALRTGATLINTARGGIIDQEALLDELAAGRINAVLDVTDPEPTPPGSPLRTLPNVFLTPHVAGSQGTELRRMVAFAVEEVRRYATGEPPLNQITRESLDLLA